MGLTLRGFLIGLIVGPLLLLFVGILYLRSGSFDVSAGAEPTWLEATLASWVVQRNRARLSVEIDTESDHETLVSGAFVFREYCASCHGNGGSFLDQARLHPTPPQLLGQPSKLSAGEIYWTIENGIRSTAMPGFRDALSEKAMREVTLFLTNQDSLPPRAKRVIEDSEYYGDENEVVVNYGDVPTEQLKQMKASHKRPKADPPHPESNPYSKAKADLGKTLFFDPRLSSTGKQSCATCHNPQRSWEDGLATAIGATGAKNPRRTPTLLDAAWNELQNWDGRAETLEQQILGPITTHSEMNFPIEKIPEVFGTVPAYRKAFSEVFPGEPLDERVLTKAIACYVRTIRSSSSPFDRWVEGDSDGMSPSAQRGFALFHGKARCVKCHSGWRFSDGAFYDIGTKTDDLGRGKHMPDFEALQYAFKNPTLRDVARRGPYLHNGSEETLKEVMELYNKGGRVTRPSMSDEIRPLSLSPEEIEDVIEFLKSLNGDKQPVTRPEIP